MVATLKFSQFYNAGDLANNNNTVGLSAGTDSIFNNPWTFLASGSTGARPAIDPSIYYRLRFNTTTTSYEYYNPGTSSWVSLNVATPFSWNVVTTSPIMMTTNNGYITNSSGLVSLVLPTVSSIGDELAITGQGSGGWRIIQGNTQVINIGNTTTTVGSTGSVSSTNQYDSLTLVCITANTEWTLVGGPQSLGLVIV